VWPQNGNSNTKNEEKNWHILRISGEFKAKIKQTEKNDTNKIFLKEVQMDVRNVRELEAKCFGHLSYTKNKRFVK
jgi:hypothetical protein